MTYSITKQYTFESAHFLPFVREGHKCKRVHGHNYKIQVTVLRCIDEEGEGLDKSGFIIDFWDLDPIVQKYIDLVDHRCLNDIEGLENPTAERIANWFWENISGDTPHDLVIERVRVYETDECYAEFVYE